MSIGLIMGGASLISGLMGRSSAKKQARAQMELARRQANAAYNNQIAIVPYSQLMNLQSLNGGFNGGDHAKHK